MGRVLFVGGHAAMEPPRGGVAAGDLEVGSVVKLMEGGVAAEYLVVNQGIPSESSLYDESCDGTWLLRKDIYESRKWHSSNVNNYADSTIHSYLNSTFLDLFSTDTQEQIKQVKIPHWNDTGSGSLVVSGTNGLPTNIFLLSGYEVGFTKNDSSYFTEDGAKLSYFENGRGASANSKRIAYLNGADSDWWLRSPSTDSATYAWEVYSDGDCIEDACSNSCGVRPALVLPKTVFFDGNTLTLRGGA